MGISTFLAYKTAPPPPPPPINLSPPPPPPTIRISHIRFSVVVNVYCVCPVNPTLSPVYVNNIHLSKVPGTVVIVVPGIGTSLNNPLLINSSAADVCLLYLMITIPEPPLRPEPLPLLAAPPPPPVPFVPTTFSLPPPPVPPVPPVPLCTPPPPPPANHPD